MAFSWNVGVIEGIADRGPLLVLHFFLQRARRVGNTIRIAGGVG